jgi:hypothetical protein
MRPTVVSRPKRRMSRPSAMAPSTEPPSESSTTVAPARSRPCTNNSKSRGVSAVMAPLAEIHSRHWAPQASAGPCRRRSKRIGSVRSVTAADAGNSETSAAEASAIANAEERVILPLLAVEPLMVGAVVRVRIGLWRLSRPPV